MRTAALIVAIALGIAAAVGVRSYIKSKETQFEREVRPVLVAVARRTIEAGEELERDAVSLQEIPANMLTSDLIGEHELGRYLGRKVTREVGRDTQLRVSHFISRDPRVASERLVQGRRAITIAVDSTTGVAGLVRPGDHVDILASTTGARRAGGGGASAETWTVLSDVTVLAVDDRMSDTAVGLQDYRGYRRGYGSITLAVTPLEAQLLAYLKDNAKLTFVLRSRAELGEREAVPVIDGSNVRQMAAQANQRRQQEIKELDELPVER